MNRTTVGELISKLQKFPEDMIVQTYQTKRTLYK
jgi:hypothetical protein